ncbi:Receptor protein kinase ANXUR2 [Spatholobus suberectus]|nr:Receptor protein kinase ANXUR2 [Spatholobus suberectus]
MSKPKQIKIDLIMGTFGYLAREYVIKDSTITDKWDVFSFGLVLLQVVWGRNYSNIPTERELLEKPVEEKIDLSIKGNISPECWQVFIDISVRCLKLEPDE